ncbi:MAG TPA: glutamate 5-kinase [Tepidisphaeraceae bacterium]|jgi:glutamate 5-kinase|nr:glutamate 5-kinase [Tepidisphaeraceae bacterium]
MESLSPAPSPRQSLKAVRTVVVKLGTQLLNDASSRLDAAFLATIAAQIATLARNGVHVSIVSSGAVSAGLRELGLDKRPVDLAKLQAVAAVGQRRLMDAWAAAFAPHDLHVGQVLLTREDVDDRTRFLNLRNTIHAIHELGAVPVINENDTVSTDEIVKITFGDNDILAALVANALRADLLVLLSVVDGILDADSQPVRLVQSIDAARALVRTEKSALGKGGMNSKVEAARAVTGSGEAMVLANGRMPDVLPRILAGDEVGTLFVPAPRKRSSRSRWIDSVRPAGIVVVDEGCAVALSKNKSLLAAGIVKVDGDFKPGDVVAIQTSDGKILGRGLSNYTAPDVERIRGKKSSEVRALLAESAYDEVIHRDNLVMM